MGAVGTDVALRAFQGQAAGRIFFHFITVRRANAKDGERLDPSDVVPAPPAGEHRIRQIFEDPEVDEWRLVELPPAEYPDLYSGYAGWKWVADEVEQREGGSQGDADY